MSDNAHGYQTTNEVPVEQVNHQDVSNAIDEKLIEQSKGLNSNDIEAEQQSEDRQNAENAENAENDQFASKFAALSRKEKDIRAREQEIERKIEEFEARMAQLNKPQIEEKEEEQKEPELPLEYRLKKDPLATLESLGVSYEDLTQLVLNDGQMPTDMQMRLMREELERDYKTKFEELENKLTEKERAEEEAKYQETINNFKSEINEFINGNEQYELIQANDAYDLVYDVIEQYYEENGRILETQEAADQVEQYLEEEIKTVFEKSKKLGSWRSESAAPQAKTEARQSPTLSNSLSAKGIESTADRPLSREESLAKLAQHIKWED